MTITPTNGNLRQRWLRNMKRGKIILLEGTDYSGKETQTDLLLNKFGKENILCEKMSFPRYNTPTGQIVGECYLGKNLKYGGGSWFGDADKVNPKIASLYYAADRKAAASEIEKIINSGTNLVLDRYVESNMGHQGGKMKSREELLKIAEYIHKLEYELLELPKPDKIIFLYMPTNVALELKKKRDKGMENLDGHESNISHLRKAEQAYLDLYLYYNWTKIDCAPDGTIKSLKEPEEIHEEIYQHIENFLS